MTRKDHILPLDGLRGLAAISILWVHIPWGSFATWIDYCNRRLWLGYLGVDVFFVLSGFLITRILLADRARQVPLHYFLIRRFLRIFPIYYLTIIALAVIDPNPPLIWCAAYLSNFYFAFDHNMHPLSHTWSLAVEEHFYLVWPFVVYLLSASRSRAFLIYGLLPVSILSGAAVILLNGYLPAEALIYRGSMFRVLSLGLGAMIAYHEPWVRGFPLKTTLLAGAMFGMGVLGVMLMQRATFFDWNPLIRMVSFSYMSCSVVLVTVAMNNKKRFPTAILSNGALRFAGRISYGLYLYHLPIYFMFGLSHTKSTPIPVLTVVIAVVMTCAVTIASYYFIEKPLLKIKDRFNADRRPIRGQPIISHQQVSGIGSSA